MEQAGAGHQSSFQCSGRVQWGAPKTLTRREEIHRGLPIICTFGLSRSARVQKGVGTWLCRSSLLCQKKIATLAIAPLFVFHLLLRRAADGRSSLQVANRKGARRKLWQRHLVVVETRAGSRRRAVSSSSIMFSNAARELLDHKQLGAEIK